MAGPESHLIASTEVAPAPVVVCQLSWGDPFRWLSAGWRDACQAWGVALFYGVCFWLMAVVLAWVFRSSPEYTMSITSGCLLLGPFLAMGLYDTSRRVQAGLPPDLGQSITSWDQQLGSMGMLVLMLMVLELLWGRASLVVFAVFFDTGMPSTTGVLQAVLQPDNWRFLLAYAAVGGLFAGLVFCTSAISLPMVLDRGTDALTAAITSFKVVLQNPGVMGLWSLLIAGLVAVSLYLPWHWPLVWIGPWLGCATWHAYRSGIQALAIDVDAPK